MLRRTYIERCLIQIYNGPPSDDANIDENLVNAWLNDGIGLAAKKNYSDNFQLDGIGYVNNSFYSTFKGLVITADENDLYKFTLPNIPLGIGENDGISRIIFKDTKNNLSYPAVILSENQVSLVRGTRPIPNKILCYPEGKIGYAITSLLLDKYTASVTLVSGGDSTNLDSEINVPDDYFSFIVEYIKAQLLFEKKQMPDLSNDGRDN